ncbi:MAG: hypothetical protein LBT62_07305 [Deltaproteobacteria bacterium]|jgi:ABC-type lipoprotein export system ATPase subunit|nr:hypothetical protein [Deltaproteobacteria bacterium]
MDDPPAISWKGLKLPLSSGRQAFVPDLDLQVGEAVLAVHSDPKILNALADLCLAIDSAPEGHLLWGGKPAPHPRRLWERLSFAKTAAMLSKKTSFLPGYTLLQNMCLDLQYNQDANDEQAVRTARQWLEKLELTSFADADQALLSGKTRGLCLTAWLMCRNPKLFILLKPLSLMGIPNFMRLWPVLRDEASFRGQSILVLDQHEKEYSQSSFDRIVKLDDNPIPDDGE